MDLSDPTRYYDLAEYFKTVENYADWEGFAFHDMEAKQALRAVVTKYVLEYPDPDETADHKELITTIVLSDLQEWGDVTPELLEGELLEDLCTMIHAVRAVLSIRWWMRMDAR